MSTTIINAEAPIALAYSSDAGTVVPLTTCCAATGKGCDGYVGCRNCYTEVHPLFGDVWNVDGSDPLLTSLPKFARATYNGWTDTYKVLLSELVDAAHADRIIAEAQRQIKEATG
jgi:hypothetical protein